MTTNADATRYPLTWPVGWVRTPYHQRKAAMFSKRVAGVNAWKRKERLTVGDGRDRLRGELRRLGARDIIISSNLRLRLDGLPIASQAKQLDDPGIAVYFTLSKAPRVLACDKWNSAAENMAAIAGHIEALRAQERYGVGTVDQAFAGYTALPPVTSEKHWSDVLGVSKDASRDAIQAAHRTLAIKHHPDRGGDAEIMAQINRARDEGLKSHEGAPR